MMGSQKITLQAPRFDWYAATIDESEGTVVDILASTLADEAPALVRGSLGYARGVEIRRAGSRSAIVYSGGSERLPHVVASGADAEELARVLRRPALAKHRVARADVCVDTDTRGAFDLLLTGLRQALTRGTKAYSIVPDVDADGATYYVGSKSSEVRARLYEKGKQMQDEQRPDWVRYEIQLRPQKDRKDWAALAPAEDMLRASRWGARFADETLGIAGQAPAVRSERVADLERAANACAAQYGKRLLELLNVHGGDVEAFALDLLARVPDAQREAS